MYNQDFISSRTIRIAEYIAEHMATVRKAAEVFGVSKSTIHKDMVERLPGIDVQLAVAVRAVMEQNLRERHIRGGEATKRRRKTTA